MSRFDSWESQVQSRDTVFIPAELPAVPRRRAEPRAAAYSGDWKIALAIVAIIPAILYLASSGVAGRSRTAPRIGDRVTVSAPGNARVFLAADGAWGRMLDAQNANNWDSINRLIAAGEVIAVANGTQGEVVHLDFLSGEVRIAEGEHEGRSGWIQIEMIRPTNQPAP